jgi:hypothetical protein
MPSLDNWQKIEYLSQMKKKIAIKFAGSSMALAEILGVSQSAVSQWGEDIPVLRVFQLKVLRPQWFK